MQKTTHATAACVAAGKEATKEKRSASSAG